MKNTLQEKNETVYTLVMISVIYTIAFVITVYVVYTVLIVVIVYKGGVWQRTWWQW